MASSTSVPIGVRNPVRAIQALRDGAPNAIARALNRSIGSAHVAMGREIARDLKIRVGDARERIRIEEATPTKHTAKLFASPKRIPVMDFKPNPKAPPSRGKGRGVSANLGRGRVVYRGAFVARMKSGHVGVFRRHVAGERKSAGAWSKNLPIKELFGPSIVKVFNAHAHVGLARAKEQLVKNVRSEFRFAARQAT